MVVAVVDPAHDPLVTIGRKNCGRLWDAHVAWRSVDEPLLEHCPGVDGGVTELVSSIHGDGDGSVRLHLLLVVVVRVNSHGLATPLISVKQYLNDCCQNSIQEGAL